LSSCDEPRAVLAHLCIFVLMYPFRRPVLPCLQVLARHCSACVLVESEVYPLHPRVHEFACHAGGYNCSLFRPSRRLHVSLATWSTVPFRTLHVSLATWSSVPFRTLHVSCQICYLSQSNTHCESDNWVISSAEERRRIRQNMYVLAINRGPCL
jgi:hypothetical protein